MPKYVGQPCTSCRKVFKEDDDIVVCPECGSPYHKECYKLEGKCINTLLHESGSEWHPEPVVMPVSQTAEIICPNCGAHNSQESFFCTSCGISLRSEKPDIDSIPRYNNMTNVQQPDNNNSLNSQRQYQDQKSPYFSPAINYQTVDERTQVDSNTAGEYMKYVGAKFYYYLPLFLKFAKGKSKISVNFAALLFPHIWLFYRKMPLQGILILIIRILTTIPTLYEYLTEFSGISSSGFVTLSGLCTIISWAVGILCGLFGNYYYYKKAKKDIDGIKSLESSYETIQTKIVSKGGVSIAYVVISMVALIIISYILALIMMLTQAM